MPAWLALCVSTVAAVLSAAALRRAKRVEHRDGFYQDWPTFTADINEVSGWYRLRLRLDGPVDVRGRVDVELLDDGLMFGQGVDGIDHGAAFPIKTAWVPTYIATGGQVAPVVEPGGMKVGNTVQWVIERRGDRAPASATVRVRARDAKRCWVTLVQADVPVGLQTDNPANVW
ncbi:hypothetical protein [Actinoplanes sp. NPDC051859]|uniref:hypothetical protein n=1 Tax=Actinoplanes sp. NPDC051859 TaxID=3363909 RepID=UPI00379F5287